jgi:hypothetical protein
MDFAKMDIGTITHGKRGDGVRYLQLFLQEYTSIFNEKVNPGCPKCLTTCLNRYKNHYIEMANTSKYRLHAKYENIPLEFGSPILVNNATLTDEYAHILLKHKNGERYFSILPKEEKLSPGKKKKAISSVNKKQSVEMKYPSENLESTTEE